MKIRMNVTTNYNGLKILGQEYEVPNEVPDLVARRWEARGIGTIVYPKAEKGRKGKQPELEPEVESGEGMLEQEVESTVVQEEQKEDGDEASDATLRYSSMKAKELFELCKKRRVNVEPRKEAQYYIGKLVEDDSKKK